MVPKFLYRLLLIPGLSGLMHAAAFGRQHTCDAATVSPSALRCAFGVKPILLPGLTSGQPYVSATDLSQMLYSTFLYPGQNAMPAAHHAAGSAIAASLQPLDANGNVNSSNGKIVAIAEGMSNTYLEMEAFRKQFFQSNPAVNPKFQFINLAQPGCDLLCWLEWGVGAIDPQVQIVLLKHSNNRPQQANGAPVTPSPPFTTAQSKRFPFHADTTHGMLEKRILDLKIKYPNLKLLFITSRSYGGWTCDPSDNTFREPVAFEEGFSVKWLVEDQVTGKGPDLAFVGPNAKAPWMAWGPYLWDSTWPQDWFEAAGGHLCTTGQTFIAKLWYDFLMQDSTSRPWFRDNVPPEVPLNLSAEVINSNQINLSWNAATDNSGSVKYEIFRDGALLKATANTSYSNIGLNPATRYCYAVSAVDSAGNKSALSNQACATTLATSVSDNLPRPLEYKLYQNHPNPLGLQTEIRFQLAEAGLVEVKIYNAFGEEIRTLAKALYAPGQHSIRWDGKDAKGNIVANGVYFYRLRAGNSSQVMKMTLMR